MLIQKVCEFGTFSFQSLIKLQHLRNLILFQVFMTFLRVTTKIVEVQNVFVFFAFFFFLLVKKTCNFSWKANFKHLNNLN